MADQKEISAAVPDKDPATENISLEDLVDEDDDEETRKMMAAKQHTIRGTLARQKAASGKARSNLTLDVKPVDSNVSMETLELRVRAIKIHGLTWLGSSLIDVAYGIKKLRITCQLVDDALTPDTIREEIEKMEEDVQSTDIFAFQMA